MNGLLSIVALGALAVSGYFLIRLIIAAIRKQPKDPYKKKLVVSVLVTIAAFWGVYATRSPEQIAAQNARNEERRLAKEKDAEEKRLAKEKDAEEKRLAEQKAAEEKKLAEQKATEEKRLAEQKATEEKQLAEQKTPEDKQLAEQKAAEEKRLAEQKAAEEQRLAEEKRRQEQAEREAKQREQALAKTLRVTPAEYNGRFLENLNAVAQIMDIAGVDYLGDLKITDNGDTETHVYMFDTAFGMNEIVDKSNGMIKEVNIATFEVSQEMIMTTLLFYAAAMNSISPELSLDEFNSIKHRLGLDANVVENLTKDKSVVYKGKRYAHRITQGGLAFSISRP